jgi:pimeloyl-ACP methyl ester carboxylesterase
MDPEDQVILLADGRELAFAEYGRPNGIPVFHFNGSGGSRLEHPESEVLNRLGVRYISSDRPGHGNSTLHPERTLLSWSDDVAALADHLQVGRFHVLGWSAGGPHALACAFRMPERVISGAIVSGLAPPERPNPLEGYKGMLWFLMVVGRRYPKLVSLFRGLVAKQVQKADSKFADRFVKSLPKEDQLPFKDDALKEMMLGDIVEGYKQGGGGPASDDILINSPWGFDIRAIQTRFDVWQGDLDKNVPFNQGEYQAEALPNSRYHLVQGKGHMLLLEQWEGVLEALVLDSVAS